MLQLPIEHARDYSEVIVIDELKFAAESEGFVNVVIGFGLINQHCSTHKKEDPSPRYQKKR